MCNVSTFDSIPAMFYALSEKRKEITLFRKRYGKKLYSCTWSEAREKVERIAAGLIGMGLEPGDRVAIMADNGPFYAFCDLAISAAGCVVVPIYTSLTAGEINHIVTNSGSKLVIAGVKAGVPRLEEARASMETPPALMLMRGAEACAVQGAHLLSTLIETMPAPETLKRIEERTSDIGHDSLCCIIFTSGTTGPPKGVMLSHGNLLSNVEASLDSIPLKEGDILLSFLPLSHTFERTAGYYAALAVGTTIHYARSLATVAQDFGECAPHTAMTVPRFLEKLHDRAMNAIKKAKPLKRKIALAALSQRMKEVKKQRLGEPIPLLTRLLSKPAKSVLKPIREKLGGRLRFLVSGGAALSVDLWDFFEAAGITVIQGYGLTETSPVISLNKVHDNRPASVGQPIRNVKIRLADDNEIETSGPSIMKGYWNNEEATRDVMTGDGWFKTGDIGTIDEHGFLYITDRKKDIIVTASGKNIAPQNIESALCLDPLIEFACVLGDGENFLGALVSPSMEALEELSKSMGLSEGELTRLTEKPEIVAAFQERIDRINKSVAPHERVARFRVTPMPFARDSGELTPTMKVRRREIQKLRAEEIEAIFNALKK